MRRRAFITGVTGQDGWYLSHHLLDHGYEVYGLVRRTSQGHVIPPGITVVEGDMTDAGVIDTVRKIVPDEIYNLAAMSHVGESFKIPYATMQINAMGTLHMLEAARATGSRFYQASTSELFGVADDPQTETTPMWPRSPYAVSKLAGYWLTRLYRDAYGLFACNGILFNHESRRRGQDFVTQKIATGVARIQLGLQDKITLGNMDVSRDWGHAADYVRGMHLMLTHRSIPDDYVLATGETHALEQFLELAFAHVHIRQWWSYVAHDPAFERPAEVYVLRGDPSKAECELGWQREWTFPALVQDMVEGAIEREIQTANRHYQGNRADQDTGNRDLERQAGG